MTFPYRRRVPGGALPRSRVTRCLWLPAVIIGAGAMLSGCMASSTVTRPRPSGSATMPDPAGCYVLVYEGAQFTGAREYINGPWKQARLTELPFRSNWRNRIRSARVGPAATVTMWTDEGLAGMSQLLASSSEHASLDMPLSGRVESIEIACGRPS